MNKVIILSYDENIIKETLSKHILAEWNIDLDEVVRNVQISNGMYVFVIEGDGFAFINNTLVDVMPGWSKTENPR